MSDRSRLRLVVLQVLVISLLATLFTRLWYLQVAAGETYQRAAADNRIRSVFTPAVRGMILDDVGRPLVNNRTALVVTVDRSQLTRQPDRGERVLERLAKVVRKPVSEIRARIQLCGPGVDKPCWNGSPYQPIPVIEDADTGMALQIMERREEFPGVTAEPEAVRTFPKPQQANAAHLLGYLSPVTDEELARQEAGRASGEIELKRTDQVGRAGLEQVYDADLRGRTGVLRVAVDHRGRVAGTVGETPSEPGNHLVTSVDAKLQAVTERELGNAIQRARGQVDKQGRHYKGDSGSAVVMDVRTGQILAMASYPTYDPMVWVGGISAKEFATLNSEKSNVPLISRATQGEFAPGSTFKAVSVAAAAAAGYPLNANYACPASYRVGNRSFTNFEGEAPGTISLKRAIELSCDTVWYRVAYELWLRDGGIHAKDPKDFFVDTAQKFHLGQPTGIDLPAESRGRVADRAWKMAKWREMKDFWCRPHRASSFYVQQIYRENCVDYWQYRAGDAVNFSIGQGETLMTPLQLTQIYAAVANGGTLYHPQIGRAVVGPDGTLVRRLPPRVAGKLPMSPATLGFLQKALAGVPVNGTARYPFTGWPLAKVPMAAKTGTAEVAGKQTTSWFASYGPANKPRYAVVMMVTQGGTGALTSGQSVRKIYESLLGVDGATVDPRKSVLPAAEPPTALPKIRPDGTVVLPKSPAASASASPAARLGPTLSPVPGALLTAPRPSVPAEPPVAPEPAATAPPAANALSERRALRATPW